MAAQYTEVTLEDMETFLKRSYRALRPKQGVQKGEYYYDLALSENVVVRVWTSVQRGSQTGAGVGQDAIRVQFYGVGIKRPLVPGKAPIVKRTQNWRDSLQDKVDNYYELYEEKASYWEAQSGGAPAQTSSPSAPAPAAPRPLPQGYPPSDKQVAFVKRLMNSQPVDILEDNGVFTLFPEVEWPFNEANIRAMPAKRVSQLIDDLIQATGFQRRYAAGDPAEYEDAV